MWIWRHNGLTIILWPNCPDWTDLGSHWLLVDGSLDISDAPQTFCRASNRRLIGWNGTVAPILFSFFIKIIPNVMMVVLMLWECWPPENEDMLLIGPLLILLHHDQSELLFLRKDRYWPRFGHFLCIPGNPAGQFWAKRKVRSFGCPRTQGFLKKWNGGLFYDFDDENYHHTSDKSDEGENDEEYLSVWGQESIPSHLSQERHESPLRTLATPFGNKNSNVGIPNISLSIKTTMATIVVTRTLPPPNIRLLPLQDSCPAAGGSIPRFPPGGKISRL